MKTKNKQGKGKNLQNKFGFLERIALEYHYNTELYDRGVCTGFSEKTGNSLPATYREMQKVNLNAHKERAEAVRKAKQVDGSIQPHEVDEAIRNVAHYSFEDLREMLEIQKNE